MFLLTNFATSIFVEGISPVFPPFFVFFFFFYKFSLRKPCLYGAEVYSPDTCQAPERKSTLIPSPASRFGSLAFTVRRLTAPIPDKLTSENPSLFLQLMRLKSPHFNTSTRLGSLAFTVRRLTAPIPDKLTNENPSLFLQSMRLKSPHF